MTNETIIAELKAKIGIYLIDGSKDFDELMNEALDKARAEGKDALLKLKQEQVRELQIKLKAGDPEHFAWMDALLYQIFSDCIKEDKKEAVK